MSTFWLSRCRGLDQPPAKPSPLVEAESSGSFVASWEQTFDASNMLPRWLRITRSFRPYTKRTVNSSVASKRRCSSALSPFSAGRDDEVLAAQNANLIAGIDLESVEAIFGLTRASPSEKRHCNKKLSCRTATNKLRFIYLSLSRLGKNLGQPIAKSPGPRLIPLPKGTGDVSHSKPSSRVHATA